MLVRLFALMGHREIHRTGSRGIFYLGFFFYYNLATRSNFLYRTKISASYEDLSNFVTFRHCWSYN